MGGKSSTSTQQVSIPPEVLARYNSVNAQASTAAKTPFQVYSTNPNAFVAQTTGQQQAGMAATDAASQQAQPYYGAATQQLAGAQNAAQPYYGAATQNVNSAQNTGNALAGTSFNSLQGASQAADPLQQAAAQNIGSAANSASPLNAAAANYYSGALGAAQPLQQQAAGNINTAQDIGGMLSAQALGTMQGANQSAAPLQDAASAAYQQAYGASQPYNAMSAAQYFQGLGGAQPLQQQAAQGIQSAYQGAQPFNAAAMGLAGAGAQAVNASPLDSAAINQYMSPYLQNVVGSEANLLNQQNQQAMAGQLGNAISSGAFGGDRAGVAAANMQQQNQLANANIFSGLLNQGYSQALGAAQQQQGVNLGASQANRAALQNASNQMLGIGQQGYSQGMGAAGQQAALGNQIFGQGATMGQGMAALGNQSYTQGMGLGQAQQGLAQQQFGQGATTAQQQAAIGQQLFGQGSTAAQQQAALGQQLYGQVSGTGQNLQGLGQQVYGQGLGTGQAQAALGNQVYSQGANTAAQQAALGQQQFGQGMTAAQQEAALGQGIYGMGANTSQQLAGLGTGAQAAGLQGAQGQLAAGQVQQQTNQAGQTALYNQFLQQQSYPFQVAQFLANIAEGTGALSGSTTTTQQPGGFFSDERLKEDIKPIGKTNDGQTIYSYKYKGDDRTQIGLLAQEVEKHHPDAVGLAGGYKTVDYEKATEDAHRSSMGGHVSGLHAAEGYAYGGSPTLPGLDAGDMSALLQAQQQMYAPFGQSGLYGGQAGGAPHGGVAGYVPQGSLPVSKLSVAEGGLKPQKSAAENMKDVAGGVKGATDMWNQGSALAGKASNFVKEHTGQTTLADAPQEAGYDMSATDSAALNNKLDQASNQMGGLAAGGVARHHFAGGGSPYGDQQGPGLDIPEEKPDAKLAVASGTPGQGRSGMQDVMDVAKIAAMFAANGGAINRHGYDDGGTPTDPNDPSQSHQTIADQTWDPNRQTIGTRLEGWLKGVTAPEHKPSTTSQMIDKYDAPPPAPAAGVAPTKPVHHVAHVSSTPDQPAGLAAATASNPNDYGPPQSPDFSSGPQHLPAAAPSPAAPTATGLVPPAQTAAQSEAPKDKQSIVDRLKNNKYVQEFGLNKQENLVPFLTGLAAMGTAPTRSLGVALASGVGAGAQSYMDTQKKAADIELTKASTGQTNANIQNIMANTGVTYQQAAGLAMDNMKKSMWKDANGMPWVTTFDGRMMPLYKWQAMQHPPSLLGQSGALGAMNDPNLPQAKAGVSTGISSPAAPAAGRTPFSASQNAISAIERDASSNSAAGQSGIARAQARTQEVKKEIGDSAEAAQTQGRQLTNLGVAVSTLPEDGVLSGSGMDAFLTPAMTSWNWAMKVAGAPAGMMFDSPTLDQKIIAGKLAAGMQFAQASSAGQHAYAALQTAAEAIPGKGIPRSTSIDLTANMMIDKQRALDLQKYEQDAYQKVQNKAAYNADIARAQFRQENSDEKYAQERQALIRLMSARDQQGKSLVAELMAGHIAARDVDQAMGAPGITRYLYNM